MNRFPTDNNSVFEGSHLNKVLEIKGSFLLSKMLAIWELVFEHVQHSFVVMQKSMKIWSYSVARLERACPCWSMDLYSSRTFPRQYLVQSRTIELKCLLINI